MPACAMDARKKSLNCRCRIKSKTGKEIVRLLFHMILDHQFKSRHDSYLHICCGFIIPHFPASVGTFDARK